MLIIGNFPKGFPFRSKTIYERCFFACICVIRKRAVLRYIRRLLAGCRLPTGKYAGILTEIQTKVKKKRQKKLATEKVETVLNFEFLVLSCGIRRWRMADFIIVFMAHNTLSKGELRL